MPGLASSASANPGGKAICRAAEDDGEPFEEMKGIRMIMRAIQSYGEGGKRADAGMMPQEGEA